MPSSNSLLVTLPNMGPVYALMLPDLSVARVDISPFASYSAGSVFDLDTVSGDVYYADLSCLRKFNARSANSLATAFETFFCVVDAKTEFFNRYGYGPSFSFIALSPDRSMVYWMNASTAYYSPTVTPAKPALLGYPGCAVYGGLELSFSTQMAFCLTVSSVSFASFNGTAFTSSFERLKQDFSYPRAVGVDRATDSVLVLDQSRVYRFALSSFGVNATAQILYSQNYLSSMWLDTTRSLLYVQPLRESRIIAIDLLTLGVVLDAGMGTVPATSGWAVDPLTNSVVYSSAPSGAVTDRYGIYKAQLAAPVVQNVTQLLCLMPGVTLRYSTPTSLLSWDWTWYYNLAPEGLLGVSFFFRPVLPNGSLGALARAVVPQPHDVPDYAWRQTPGRFSIHPSVSSPLVTVWWMGPSPWDGWSADFDASAPGPIVHSQAPKLRLPSLVLRDAYRSTRLYASPATVAQIDTGRLLVLDRQTGSSLPKSRYLPQQLGAAQQSGWLADWDAFEVGSSLLVCYLSTNNTLVVQDEHSASAYSLQVPSLFKATRVACAAGRAYVGVCGASGIACLINRVDFASGGNSSTIAVVPSVGSLSLVRMR